MNKNSNTKKVIDSQKKLQRLLNSLFGNKCLYFIKRKFNPVFYNSKVQQILESDFKTISVPAVKYGFDMLANFIHNKTASPCYKENIAVFFNPVPFDNNNGQRSVRFAQEFVKKGYKVVFVVCIPNDIPQLVNIYEDHIFQMPFNWFFPNYKLFFSLGFSTYKNKAIVNFLTYKQSLEIIDYAKQKKWTTVYDIIDDWEEFYHDGYWPTYSKNIEEKLVKDSDIVLAINNPIKQKFSFIRNITVIPNGYSPELLNKEQYMKFKHSNKIKQGNYDLLIGSFGYLHPFRFNWQLIINTAKKRKNWLFEIIGFGEPAFLKLPANVKLLGGMAPHELYKYAQHWDVAIAPYHNNSLCKKLNPIKIFEFLYFELPVVVYGCHDITTLPYTYYAENEADFGRKIEYASKQVLNSDKLNDFLKTATWEFRVHWLCNQIEQLPKVTETANATDVVND